MAQVPPTASAPAHTRPPKRPDGEDAPPERRPGGVTLAGVVGLIFVVIGFWYGAGALHDNSFFTHLAAGRLILHGHFPYHDPFSFTAHGASWVVQSWLPALSYAVAERAGGAVAIRAWSGLIVAVLMALVWRLTRPAEKLVPRVAIAALTFAVGAGMWATRPFMIGLVCLAATLVIVEERRRPVWLIPIFWVWVNSHGSWPLGLVLLGVWAIGLRADKEDAAVPLRALKFSLIGTLLGAVGPLGPKALTFPIALLGRSKMLQHVVEWQAPTFKDLPQRLFLLTVIVAIVAVARSPRYRHALLIGVFVAAALLGSRNVVVASLVLVPVLAHSLSGLGSLEGDRRSGPITMAAAALVLVGVIGGIGRLQGPSWALTPYPQKATTYLVDHGLLGGDHHVVARDLVGNYWELRFGAKVQVFFDDRFDMYPTAVNDDDTTLSTAGPGWQKVLQRYHPDAVLWERSAPLTQVLDASRNWRRVYRDANWVIFVPR